MKTFDTLADINVVATERQISNLEAAHPDISARDICQVTVELLRTYHRSLHTRDQAAAYLVRHAGWSYADVAAHICGHPEHAERAKAVTAAVEVPEQLTDAPEQLIAAQRTSTELRALLGRALTVAADALPAARVAPYLPADPAGRVAYCAQWLRYISTFRSAIDASRNLAAAILVIHHGWSLSEIARIAHTSPDAITAASEAARLNPPSAADSDLVRQMGRLSQALAHNGKRMLAARRHAIARCRQVGMSDAMVAAHGGFALV
jgi:hypothetical protein